MVVRIVGIADERHDAVNQSLDFSEPLVLFDLVILSGVTHPLCPVAACLPGIVAELMILQD